VGTRGKKLIIRSPAVRRPRKLDRPRFCEKIRQLVKVKKLPGAEKQLGGRYRGEKSWEEGGSSIAKQGRVPGKAADQDHRRAGQKSREDEREKEEGQLKERGKLEDVGEKKLRGP